MRKRRKLLRAWFFVLAAVGLAVGFRLWFPLGIKPGRYIANESFGVTGIRASEAIPIGFGVQPQEQVYTVEIGVWNRSSSKRLDIDLEAYEVSDASGRLLRRVSASQLFAGLYRPVPPGKKQTVGVAYIGRKGLRELHVRLRAQPGWADLHRRLLSGNLYVRVPVEGFNGPQLR